MKAMFTLTAFEILLLEGRSVLLPFQRGAGSERVKKNVHNVRKIKCKKYFHSLPAVDEL